MESSTPGAMTLPEERPEGVQQHTPVAVHYRPEGYETTGKHLMGRHSAGEGFMRALAQFSNAPIIGCHSPERRDFAVFDKQVQSNSPHPRKTQWIDAADQGAVAPFGCLYVPGPNLSELAWRRRVIGENAYSLCGITHTIASAGAMQSITDLLLAPIEPWDALICTSQAVKVSALRIVEHFGDYLEQRFGTKPKLLPELPVIPLGVDTARFAGRPGARAAWREKLGLSADTIVFLFVGRLSFHAKAHPLPMYLALERAARQSGRKVALIQAGWFSNDKQEKAFVDAAKVHSPSVECRFVDGRKPDVRSEIWQAADVFISLSDNVQESFGLTPIEAMAAGLPVIASDWDGYRQTVTHGVTGLMVPTAMATESAGFELAQRFVEGVDNYDTYIGGTTQAVAVDVEAATAACLQMIENADLRAEMGARGRREAAEIFDWRHVIARYEELWAELAQRRAAARVPAAKSRSDLLPPMQGNPLRIFANYATRIVGDDARLAIATPDAQTAMDATISNPMNNSFDYLLIPLERRKLMLSLVEATPAISVTELIDKLTPKSSDRLRRTVTWMLKCGLIKLV